MILAADCGGVKFDGLPVMMISAVLNTQLPADLTDLLPSFTSTFHEASPEHHVTSQCSQTLHIDMGSAVIATVRHM